MRASTWIDGALALVLLASGLALQNCVFLATAALLGISGFYRHMDSFRPGQPMRAGLRCIGAGIASIATAVAMGLVLLTGAFGFWPPVGAFALVAGGLLATIAMVSRAAIAADPSGDVRLDERSAH